MECAYFPNDKKLIAGCNALKKAGKVMKTSINTLSDGMSKLDAGAGELNKASDELVKGAGTLGDGTGALFSGAKKLRDGFTEFREKAIDKLINLYNDDIKDLVDRVQEIMDAGKEYKSFSGIDNSMGGEVKFIIETEAVKAEE